MDIQDNFRKAAKHREDFYVKAKENYHSRSKDRLDKSIEKKFRTTFIGALSAFEDAFGEVWGHRLPEHELTDEQYRRRRLWEQVRTTVLNNGNNQLRAAQSEIAEYTIEWNRHQVTIPETYLKKKD